MAEGENTVACNTLVETIQRLIREGNLRRVRIMHQGRTLVDVPLTVGAPVTVGAILAAPILTALGAVAALITNCTLEVEKVERKEE